MGTNMWRLYVLFAVALVAQRHVVDAAYVSEVQPLNDVRAKTSFVVMSTHNVSYSLSHTIFVVTIELSQQLRRKLLLPGQMNRERR